MKFLKTIQIMKILMCMQLMKIMKTVQVIMIKKDHKQKDKSANKASELKDK